MTTDISGLLDVAWTAVILPLISYIGKQLYDWLKSKKLDKYGTILYTELKNAVKSVYETEVKEIKNDPEQWTPEKQAAVRELAKTKTIQALSSAVYHALREVNCDLDEYLDSLIGTALYDLKHEKVE